MRTSMLVGSTRSYDQPSALAEGGARPRKRMSFMAMVASASFVLAPQALAADPSRPIEGSCDTVFAFTATGAIQIDGICRYAHLGHVTVSALQIVVPQPDGSDLITNTSVYTAANGDQLYANTAGTGHFTSPTTVEFTGTETYAGGTGRFLHATGSSSLIGGAEFLGLTGHYAVTGRIAY